MENHLTIKPPKVVVQGFGKVLSFFASWLKTPEERELLLGQATRERSAAGKVKLDAFTDNLKKIAETRSLELQVLRTAIELYGEMGYSEEQIRELVGPKLNKLVEVHDDLNTLKHLVEKGIILEARVRDYTPPEGSNE